jgi:hypothetical protein
MKYKAKNQGEPSNKAIEKLVLMLSYQKVNPLPTDTPSWNNSNVSRV